MTTDNRPQPEAQRIISDVEALKVYFDPVRIRIIGQLAGEPRSIHQVAAALGLPFTRLYYQFGLLEKHGLIRVVETRAIAGAVEEKFYQIAARQFIIDRKLLTLGTTAERDSGLDVILDTVLDQTRDDVYRSIRAGLVDLGQTAPHPAALLMRRGVWRLTPELAAQFSERLIALIKEFAEESGGDQQHYYALAVAFYPTAITLSGEDSSDTDTADSAR
jgi:DNA-binding transcriptional ArsR family regulator